LKYYQFLFKRVGWAVLTVFFVIALNFFLFRVLPGDPARQGLRDPRLTADAIEAIRVRFGLDKPVINCIESLNPLNLGSCLIDPFETQFFIYAANLLRGELGISYHTNRPVADLLAEDLWNTILLIGAGQILAIVLGMGLGILAAWKSHTIFDHITMVAGLVAWSLPTYFLGIVLLFWGTRELGLPISGKVTTGVEFGSTMDRWLDIGRHLILPTLTYAIVYMGEYLLFMRSTMLEVLSEDYILTAKAKGLSTQRILFKHALSNSTLPIVTIIALNLGFTVAGAIFIEAVFSWPGLGQATVEALNRRDYPMLQGTFLLLAVCVIFANLIAELLYSYLDPRVKVE
jgi:peptide/nickel transport system permease protein